MTGFEVEREAEGGGHCGEWGPVQKSDSEDNCRPVSPLGFWIINKDKEADYQVLSVYFVWNSLCLWRGNEDLASLAL